MSRVNQPVLQLLPARARPVGPSAGLLEGPEGGVVFVFGLATFSYANADLAGRRLAAVQLVTTMECRMFFGLVICWFLRLRNGFGTIPVRLHSGSGIPTPSGAVSDCNAVRSIEQYL